MEQDARKKMLKKADGLKKAGRSFWFFGKRLILFMLFFSLCIGSFTLCARLSGLYVLVNEGMSLRIEFILKDASISDMRHYFTEKCLLNDSRLQDMTYSEFTVTGYSYSLDFVRISVWPWQTAIEADVVERVESISGTYNENDTSAPPAWIPLKYRIKAIKENGSWRIDSVTVLEVNPVQSPSSTFDPNVTPMPMATAVPQS